jgi:lipoprotein-anchoring transpeptidase ErfK/SrfK
MRRGVSFLLGVLGCAAAGVLAAAFVASPGRSQLPITTGTTGTTPTTTASTTTRTVEADLIAEGVWVGRVEVGGLTPEGARALVQSEFDEALRLRFGHETILVTPQRLGATARVKLAIDQARRAGPNTRLPLFVNLRAGGVARYVKALGRRFDRRARNAELQGLRQQRPWITKERVGRVLRRRAAVREIVAALRTHQRAVLRIRADRIDPAVTRARFGPIVVIRRDSKRLSLFRGMRLWKRFGVATGQSSYPTPTGRFSIVTMQRNPWWYPPDSDWAKDEEPIPPGPGNPLGTRWMGISSPGVGMHGTPDAASIGYSASHGCIRMRIPEAEWLFQHVRVGTPVFIVAA